jgi:hypothetical protein
MELKGHVKIFSASCASKKRKGRSRSTEILCWRMALRTNNMPSGRFKNIFIDVDEAMFQGFKTLQNHFLPPRHRKKRLGRIRFSDVSSTRMALNTHNIPSERVKNEFFDVNKATFQGVKRPYEIIFCSLRIEKAVFTKSLK